MAEKIDGTGNAVINNVRFAQQTSHPSSPSSGYELLYIISGSAHGGLYVKDSSGREIGPFITGSSGEGAPTDAKYVTTAADGTLSNEVVIPGLAGSADIAGAGGAGVSHEFDSGASPLTWSVAVDSEDVNTTVKSHLFVEDNGSGEPIGTYDWSPAGAFDIRCKVSVGARSPATGVIGNGMIIGDSAMNNRCRIIIVGGPTTYTVRAYTYAGSYTQRGSSMSINSNYSYLRITRDGSNNVSFWCSQDGIMWYLIATQAFTFTCAKAGFTLGNGGTANITNLAVDYIRSDV